MANMRVFCCIYLVRIIVLLGKLSGFNEVGTSRFREKEFIALSISIDTK